MRIRSYSARTTHILTLDDDSEVELQHRPSEIHCYKDVLVERVGNKLVVGYLSDDSNCENPLDDDGMGRILGRGKYATRSGGGEIEMFEALGLDRNGDVDYELVRDELGEAFDLYLDELQPATLDAIAKALGIDPHTEHGETIVDTLIEMLKREDVFNSEMLWVLTTAACTGRFPVAARNAASTHPAALVSGSPTTAPVLRSPGVRRSTPRTRCAPAPSNSAARARSTNSWT